MRMKRRLIASALCGVSAWVAMPAGAQMVFPTNVARPIESGTAEEAGLLFRAGLGSQGIDNIYGTTSGHASDVVTSESLGMSLKSSYSLQKLVLDASVNSNQYATHSDLNYTGTTLSGAWQWSSGSNLFGLVTGSRTVTQNSIGTSVNSTQRNLNTSQNTSALLGYDFGGGWQITGGGLQASSMNDQQVYGQALVSQYSGAFVASTYVFTSGNSMSLRALSGTGTNTYDFAVKATEFRVDSVSNVGTTVGGQLTYWQQSYSAHPEYDFSGYMGRFAVAWVPSEKTTIQWAVQRQLYGVPLATAVYTVTDSVTLVPAWMMTPKITLQANLQKSVIRYQGDPGGGASGQVDNFQTLGASLVWKTSDRADISVMYSKVNHTSNLSSEVEINTISVLGKIAF
jgi:hypothetical protein